MNDIFTLLYPFLHSSLEVRETVLRFLTLKECLVSSVTQKESGSGCCLPPTLPSRFWVYVAKMSQGYEVPKAVSEQRHPVKHMHSIRHQRNHSSGCWRPALGSPAPHQPVDACPVTHCSVSAQWHLQLVLGDCVIKPTEKSGRCPSFGSGFMICDNPLLYYKRGFENCRAIKSFHWAVGREPFNKHKNPIKNICIYI